MRFRFRLRTLLLAVLVLSLSLAMVAPRIQRSRREQAVVAQIKRLGGDVYYHHEMSPDLNPGATPPGPAWFRAIFGEHCLATVHTVWLQHFDVPAWKHPPLTDDQLKLLAPLSDLQAVMLDGSAITDDGLKYLMMHPLKELHLGGTTISDKGVEQLRELQTLERLNLGGTKVTDASLEHIRTMRKLKWVHVGGTKVKAATIDEFNRANSRQLVLDGRELGVARP